MVIDAGDAGAPSNPGEGEGEGQGEREECVEREKGVFSQPLKA